MTMLKLAEGLALPLECVTEKLGFLGRTGSGKTYAALKLAEEMHRAGAQFVAVDPVGKWWSLRLAANGKDPGLAIPVFGGLQGDIPIEPGGGKLLADVIVDRGVSAVLDVSQFESDAAKARFAADFADRLFFRKKATPTALHIFIEEAQEFVPQNPQRDEARMLHVWTRIQKLGRNFGIGTSLLSQRPQEVNKKCLNQTELLFVFQLTGPQERKAIAGWISEKGIDADIEAELPKLARGKPHAWSPAWLDISRVVRILPRTTFDASSTPKVGARAAERPLAPIDLVKLRTDMAATIERAKAEDPKELRRLVAEKDRRIRELEKGSPLKQSGVSAPIPQVKRVEVPVLKEGQVKRLETVALGLGKLGERFTVLGSQIVSAAVDVTVALSKFNGNGGRPAPPGNVTRSVSLPQGTARAVSRPVPVLASRSGTGPADSGLPRGERAILTATAQYESDGVDRKQLTVLTGYKRSTRDAYVQRLGEKGYVTVQGDRVLPTDAGVGALGADYQPLPIGDELREHWMARLPEGERKCLEVVAEAYPDPVDRERISETTGYKRSTRDAYLQRLGSRRLVLASRDGVTASRELFG